MTMYDVFKAVAALEEFRGLPHHQTAVRHIAHVATETDGPGLRAEVRRVSHAFKDYRAEAAFWGDAL